LFVRLLPAQVRAKVFSYADDTALVRVLEAEDTTEAGLRRVTAEINADLAALVEWGRQWGTQFEPSKNEHMVVSRKLHPAQFPELRCQGVRVKQVGQMKLVGFVLDSKLGWAGMVDRVCSKARARLGALFRMCGVLDSENKVLMYKAFIRSVLEFGCLQYMAAAPTHLHKLDTVQRMAERICGCSFEALAGRREAAAFGLACKLLDGECRGDLQCFKPELMVVEEGRTRGASAQGVCLKRTSTAGSLDGFKRSFQGSVDAIFAKVPQDILQDGLKDGWRKVMKAGQRALSKN
jgi:hypothetical protein